MASCTGAAVGAFVALFVGLLIPWSLLRQQKRGVERLAQGDPHEPWWYVKRTRIAELPLSADEAFEFCARKILRRHPGGKLLEEYRMTGAFGDRSTRIELVSFGTSRTDVRVDVYLPGLQLVDDGSLLKRAEDVARILRAQRDPSPF